MSLHRLLLVLRGRWRLALVLFLAVVGADVAISLLLPKQYIATATVVADSTKSDPLAPPVAGPDQLAFMATQVGIITSDRVVTDVAKTLQFDTTSSVRQKWERATHGQTEFTVWFAKRLRRSLTATASGDSNIIEISVKWPDPNVAATIADAFAQSYINTNTALRVMPAQQYTRMFDQRSRELRADLQAKQQRLADFQNQSGIVPSDERIDIESARLSELSSQLSAIQAQRQDSQSRQYQMTGQIDSAPDILQSQLVASLKGDLARAEAKQQNIETTLGVNHPEFISNAAEIDSLRARIATESNRIAASVGNTTQVNLRREYDVKAAIEAQKRRLIELKHSRDEAAVLQNDVATAQRNLDTVTQHLAQSSLEGGAQQGNVAQLAPAIVPDEPSSPNLVINAVIGVFFGLVLGVGTALLRESADRRIRSGEELEKMLGVPLLGTISRIGRRDILAPSGAPRLIRLES